MEVLSFGCLNIDIENIENLLNEWRINWEANEKKIYIYMYIFLRKNIFA